jgi:hypothetical protein
MQSLYQLTKSFIKKELSRELLYEHVSKQRLSEIQTVYDIIDDLSNRKRHHAARVIQKYVRHYNLIHMTVIRKCSVCETGETLYYSKKHNIRFRLQCDNFNYYSYMRPNEVRLIEVVTPNVVRIHHNRYIVRHCYDRYIDVNLENKCITITEVNTTGNITFSNKLESKCMSVRV